MFWCIDRLFFYLSQTQREEYCLLCCWGNNYIFIIQSFFNKRKAGWILKVPCLANGTMATSFACSTSHKVRAKTFSSEKRDVTKGSDTSLICVLGQWQHPTHWDNLIFNPFPNMWEAQQSISLCTKPKIDYYAGDLWSFLGNQLWETTPNRNLRCRSIPSVYDQKILQTEATVSMNAANQWKIKILSNIVLAQTNTNKISASTPSPDVHWNKSIPSLN